MKTVKSLFVIVFLFVTSAFAQDMQYVSSQRGDTLVVKDDIEFGDINTLYLLLASDNLAPASRVYELQNGGIYSLANNPVTSTEYRTVIMGESEESVKTCQGEAPPIISGAYTTGVNTSGGINVSKDLLIKNVDLEIGNAAGNWGGWAFFNFTGPGYRLQVDNCIMEHTWWTWVGGPPADSRIFFTNNYIVNLNGHSCRRNGGVTDFINMSATHQDTLLVENCTHVNTQGSLYRLRLGFTVNRVIFNHNNFIDNAGYIIMNNGNVANMSVTNNIYVNCQLQAYCPVLSHVDIGEVDEDGLPMGLINLRDDPTFQENGASFYADRNLAYWDPSLSDIVSTLNSNEVNGSTEWVSQMITMNSRTADMFYDNATYPRVTNGTWYNQLPNFADTDVLFTNQLAVLKEYAIAAVDTTYGTPLASWRQPSNPEASYYIIADYPIPIDLSYDNADLLNAGLGGFPLGDLSWFPTEYEAWKVQKAAEYSRIADILLNGSIEFKSNFGVDINEGRIPLTVEFTDSSTGAVAFWQWDFENDGIIDSYDQNPTWTFLEADTYSVKLITLNSIVSDTLIKEDYIITYFDSIPNLYSVKDIPNDQGGWVDVSFARSLYDTDSLNLTETYSIEMNDGSGWISVIDTLASAKNIYSILISTPFDSNASSKGLLNFRVIANMNEGTFVSDSLQGFSTDNIFPTVPQNLISQLTDDLYAKLSWSSVQDIDFSHYLLYRSTAGSSLEVFKTLTDTFYTDSSVVLANLYAYALQSVDSSGNNSELSNIVEIIIDNPPQISALPSISFNEDDSLSYTISDWYPYMSDPEHPDSVLMIDIISNDNIFSRLETDHFIFKTKENWNGSDSLTFILSDGTLSDSTMLHFNITPVNDPPQIVDLPDSLGFNVDTTVVLTMKEYAFDVDSPDSLLKWNFESKSDSVVISYDSVSTRLTISSLNYIGESIIKCLVTDGYIQTADSILVRIYPATSINNQLYSGIPDNYTLYQNYPNPFNPTTTIRYGLKQSCNVKITIYNSLGRKIIELINERQDAGYHQAIWNGKNYLNQQVSSGIYFYRLSTENFTAIKRMVFIK